MGAPEYLKTFANKLYCVKTSETLCTCTPRQRESSLSFETRSNLFCVSFPTDRRPPSSESGERFRIIPEGGPSPTGESPKEAKKSRWWRRGSKNEEKR